MDPSEPIRRKCFFGKICRAAFASVLTPLAGAATEEKKKFTLLDHPRHKRDFGDIRSRKVIFLAHCIPNMNARMHRCANVFPAVVEPVIRCCLDNALGIVQMPCPELMVVGLGRDRDEPEVEYLRQALEEPVSRERIRALAEQVVFQMREYRFQGFRMVGVVGSNGSPSCGVEQTAFSDPDRGFGPGQGVFIQELQALMNEAGLDLPFKGMDEEKIEETVAWIQENLKKSG